MSKQTLEDFLGRDPKFFIDSANTVYKLAWEQILLLALYTRQQFLEERYDTYCSLESSINFKNKIKLIYLLFSDKNDENTEWLKDQVLEKLEKYKDIHEITNFLTNISKLNNDEQAGQAKKMLASIAHNHISFTSGSHRKHPYSYYSMYKALSDALFIFRKLLEIDFSEAYIIKIYIESIDYVFTRRGRISPNDKGYDFYNSIKQVTEPEEILKLLKSPSNQDYIRKAEDLSKEMELYLSEHLGKVVSDIYSLVKKPDAFEANFSKKNPSTFDQITKIDSEVDDKGNKVIRIKENALSALISLGKVDDVFHAIKNNVLKIYGKESPRDKQRHAGDKSAITNIVNWYEQSRTELCPSLVDCPRLVASILEFDLRNGIGVFDPNYGIPVPIDKKVWFAKDNYLLVTGFIRRFLFKTGDPSNLFLPSHDVKKEFELSIQTYINNLYQYNGFGSREKLSQSLEHLDNLNNPLMEKWAEINFDSSFSEESKEYKAMISRFKKAPIYLKPESQDGIEQARTLAQTENLHKRKKLGIWSIYNLISIQKDSSKESSYPIDSSFPLPLWVNLERQEIDKETSEQLNK